MSDSTPRFPVIIGGRSQTETRAEPVNLVLTPAGVAGSGGGPHDPGMESRVAVLEQIAKETRDAIADLRSEIRAGVADLRTEMRGLRTDARSDYRWLLGIMLGGFTALLGVMAHGFHWL